MFETLHELGSTILEFTAMKECGWPFMSENSCLEMELLKVKVSLKVYYYYFRGKGEKNSRFILEAAMEHIDTRFTIAYSSHHFSAFGVLTIHYDLVSGET